MREIRIVKSFIRSRYYSGASKEDLGATPAPTPPKQGEQMGQEQKRRRTN